MSPEGKMAVGGLVCAAGLVVTLASLAAGGDTFLLAYGAILGGAIQFAVGAVQSSREEAPEPEDPIAHPARLVSGEIREDDYPAVAIRSGEEGSTTVAFTVGADGRVRDAEVVGSSGSRALDEASRRLIAERFAYEPAKDINMNPRPVRKQQTITWQLPD